MGAFQATERKFFVTQNCVSIGPPGECRTAILSAGPFTILLFYYFISIRFQIEVFASRVAKPECRTTIFTGRPAVFASRVAKPECRTTIFTGRPAVFASRVAKPECRTTIFTGRPDRLLFYYFTISFPFGSRSPRVFLHLGQPLACRLTFFACRAANPTYTSAAPQHFPAVFLHLGQPFLHVSSRFCMSAKRIPSNLPGKEATRNRLGHCSCKLTTSLETNTSRARQYQLDLKRT